MSRGTWSYYPIVIFGITITPSKMDEENTMLLARMVTIDPLAWIAIAFLVITVGITLGLGIWLVGHMGKQKKV